MSSQPDARLARVHLKARDRIDLIGNFSTMLSAGIPILEVAETLKEDSTGAQLLIMSHMTDDLRSGRHLHETLAKFPRVFDKLTVNFIRASEEAGTLEKTLQDLHHTMEEELEFSDKVKSAMFYPMIVMTVFSVILLVILIFVIPQIGEIFSRMPFPLPPSTRFMIFISDILTGSTWWVLGFLGTSIGGMSYLYSQKREWFIRALVYLPGVRQLIFKIDLAHFSHSMSLLLSAGLPLTRSLELAVPLIMSKPVRDAAERAQQVALEGKQIAVGLKGKNSPVPSLIIKLIEVGERTGTLEKSMNQVSDHMQYDVKRSLEKFTALLEPLMLVIVGILVGSLMYAIISPVYGIISQVQA